MPIARRQFLSSALASLAAPGVLRQARADAPAVLKLHHAFAAMSAVHEKFLAPWARKVEADSEGRIRIDLIPSMQLGGAPSRLFDQARDGVTELAWAALASTPGRFAGIEAFELPFLLSHRALVNSRALQDYAAADLQDEFKDVHPICFSCRDHGVLHAARPIRTIDDLRGLRLQVPHRLAGDAVRALGAHSIEVPTPQVPMALVAHAIDGCLDPWDAVPGLRLADTLKHHTDFADQALSAATFILAMNKPAYERLPRELKSVLDNNSGQAAAGMAGAMWELEGMTVAAATRARGDSVVTLDADEIARWRKATEPVAAAWQKQVRERKLDGGRLIAQVLTLLSKYASEPELQPPPPSPPQPAQSAPPAQPVAASQPAPSAPPTPPTKTNINAVVPPKAEAAKTVAPPVAARSPAPPPVAIKPKELDIPL